MLRAVIFLLVSIFILFPLTLKIIFSTLSIGGVLVVGMMWMTALAVTVFYKSK